MWFVMRSLKLLIFSSLVALLSATSVIACSCMPTAGPEKEIEQADAVFAGKVISSKRQNGARPFDDIEVEFVVDRVWKGQVTKRFRIFTAESSASCGYRFKKNRTYLVYAYGKGNEGLQTGICSRTRRLKDAHQDLIVLGAGRRPAP